jgi:hypothetical protein
MARKGRFKRITKVTTDEEEKDFETLAIEGTKITAMPESKEK